MGTTHAQAFTASGTWTCPVGVTAAWLTMVGGGGGSPAGRDVGGFLGGTGGAGSGESVVNVLIPVVPTTVYSVTVGAGGLASAYNNAPTLGTASVFDVFRALPAGTYPVPHGYANSGAGGGAGGGAGFNAGGGRTWLALREGSRWTGGEAGGGGGAYVYPITMPNSSGSGVQGGVMSDVTADDGGGAGGGAIWGGTDGPANLSDANSASATHYGAGASGASTASSGFTTAGGNGAGGYVMIMWVE